MTARSSVLSAFDLLPTCDRTNAECDHTPTASAVGRTQRLRRVAGSPQPASQTQPSASPARSRLVGQPQRAMGSFDIARLHQADVLSRPGGRQTHAESGQDPDALVQAVASAALAVTKPPAPVLDAPAGTLLKPLDACVESWLESVGEFVVCVDASFRVVGCTSGYPKALGLEKSDVIGRRVHDFVRDFERSSFYEAFVRCLETGESTIQIGYSQALGKHISNRLHPCPGGGFVVTSAPASEQMIHGHEVALQGKVDKLTRLGNRFGLEEDLRQLLGRDSVAHLVLLEWTEHQGAAVRLGMDRADAVMLTLVSRARAALQPCERLYRIDSAVLGVVRQCALDSAHQHERARELAACLAQPVQAGEEAIVPLVHGALAMSPPHDEAVGPAAGAIRAERQLRQAHIALHHARRETGSRVVLYGSEHDGRLKLEAELVRALASDEFVLYAQPKVDVVRQEVCGAELLVRWRHPERGLLPPGVFLGIAAEMRLMPAIDAWVVERALDHQRDLVKQGLRLPLSINVCAATLSDNEFVGRLARGLALRGLEPGLIEVEIPEGDVMEDIATSTRVLAQLREIGVRLSIDDFGTGHASFLYLSEFPIDTLKIDRSFVFTLDTKPRSAVLVDAMVRVGHALGLRVLAEGAETPEHLRVLNALGCDEVQGYVFARPMPLEDFVEFVAKPLDESLFDGAPMTF